MQKNSTQEIVLYTGSKGAEKVEVRMDKETVWLTQAQIAQFFDTDRTSITRHINNIINSAELSEESNVQFLHIANSDKPVKFYDLDMILSVGYRVNSKRATQFRIWATSVLRDHILKGYTINETRLKETSARAHELERAVRLIRGAMETRALKSGEARGLLTVITEYTHTWSLLQQYDDSQLKLQRTRTTNFKTIAYNEACAAIAELKRHILHKKEAGSLFGLEREHGLERVLGAISQTFAGVVLYPSLEERAAHLLYFIIKDHPFSDGNKRIGAFMFVRFLEINAFGRNKKGERKINPNTLVALALLIAESKPAEKEIMVALVTNLLQ
jgi:prophage maintenance system killer protein